MIVGIASSGSSEQSGSAENPRMKINKKVNQYSLSFTSSLAEICSVIREWDELANNCSDDNVFFESSLLVPALKHLSNQAVQLAIVRLGSSEMIGLVPVVFCQSYRGLPLRHISVWRHLNCFNCTPLIRSGHELEFFPQFLALSSRDPPCCFAFHFCKAMARWHKP